MSVNDNITKEKCDHMKMQFSVFLAFFSLGRFSHSLAGVTRSSSFESVRKITGYREYSKPNIFYKKVGFPMPIRNGSIVSITAPTVWLY